MFNNNETYKSFLLTKSLLLLIEVREQMIHSGVSFSPLLCSMCTRLRGSPLRASPRTEIPVGYGIYLFFITEKSPDLRTEFISVLAFGKGTISESCLGVIPVITN